MSDKRENIQEVRLVQEKKSKLDIANVIVQMVSTGLAVVVSFLALFIGGQVINNINQLSQGQQQLQQQLQDQYQQQVQNQQQLQQQLQTQVVIEPRDGDIIVHIGDDYKLLQLIQYEDIVFPSKIQEIKVDNEKSVIENRVDIANEEQEDWLSKDSFKYIISNFSINPNKVINLLGTIESLSVYCDFYQEKNISTFISLNEKDAYLFKIIDGNNKDIKVSNINTESEKEYVTNEINNGIEWVKIRVEIVYAIEVDGKMTRITDTIISDLIPTDADF